MLRISTFASVAMCAVLIGSVCCSYLFSFVLVNYSDHALIVEYSFDLGESGRYCPLARSDDTGPLSVKAKRVKKHFPSQKATPIEQYEIDADACTARLLLPGNTAVLLFTSGHPSWALDDLEARVAFATQEHEVEYRGRALYEAFTRRSMTLFVLEYGHAPR